MVIDFSGNNLIIPDQWEFGKWGGDWKIAKLFFTVNLKGKDDVGRECMFRENK
jgi:hypothetical protein